MEVDQEELPQASSTPSRLSLAALLSPSSSPRPSATPGRAAEGLHDAASGSTSFTSRNGAAVADKDNGVVVDDEDAEMLDASQADQLTALRVVPSRRAKEAAKGADDSSQQDVGAEDEEEEGDADFVGGGERGGDDENLDDDDDDDDDDDEDDDDEDDEDDESSGTGDSATDAALEEEDIERPNDALRASQNGNGHPNGNDEDDEDDRDSMMEELAGEPAAQDGAAAASSSSQGQIVDATNGISKKKTWKRRSPSVDPALPTGPPPRSTVRLRIKLSLNDEDSYLVNVPDEVYKVFKKDKPDDAWAKWYESTMPAASEADDEDDGDAEMPDTSDLGGLARLLAKYPANLGKKANGKMKKKDKNMDYEIGEYDTRDPFVDDSELNVDEPTYAAKPSADGFFVHEGEVQLQEVERDKQEANREELLMLATRRGQMPAGFGQTDKETGSGGAGALYLQLGSKVSYTEVVNCMLSLHAIKFGIMSQEEDEEDRKNQQEATRSQQTDEPSVAANESVTELRGSRSSPIPLDSDDAKYVKKQLEEDEPPFQPIQAVKYPVEPIPKRLMQELTKLRRMAAQESWLKKSKFPQNLRDPTIKAINIALALNELNENFLRWLPQVYPYNLLTLRKYVRRQFYDQHVEYMDKLVTLNEAGMKKQIDELYEKLSKEYSDAMTAWLARTEGGGGDVEAEKTLPGAAADDVEQHHGEGDEEEGGGGGEAGGDDDEGPPPPANKNAKPVRRWQWTEPLRETLFTILTIHNAKAELFAEKKAMETKEEVKVSTINARKIIYKGLLELWPEQGWITTTAMSNQYGLYKRRVEKFAQILNDEKDDVPGAASNVALY